MIFKDLLYSRSLSAICQNNQVIHQICNFIIVLLLVKASLFWIIYRCSTTSRNFMVINQMLFFTADLTLPYREQHTGTKGHLQTYRQFPRGLGVPRPFISSYFSAIFILFYMYVHAMPETQSKLYSRLFISNREKISIFYHYLYKNIGLNESNIWTYKAYLY